jgi:ribosomal-protein-alanine N-acetyltransferase
MPAIESERLKLIPLDLLQLELLIQGRDMLEKHLKLKHLPLALSAGKSFLEDFEQTLTEFIIPGVKKHPDNFIWFTHWLIVEKSSNTCIGGIGCNGMPDEQGQVMVGYYIAKNSEGLGFATEALGCFINWLKQEPALRFVLADTPIDHIASQKVLGNNGFILLGEVEDGFRWQLALSGR